MRAKEILSALPVPSHVVKLVFSRVTLSKITIAYFAVALLHMCILVGFQVGSHVANRDASERFSVIMTQANVDVKRIPVIVPNGDGSGDTLKLCNGIPQSRDDQACEAVVNAPPASSVVREEEPTKDVTPRPQEDNEEKDDEEEEEEETQDGVRTGVNLANTNRPPASGESSSNSASFTASDSDAAEPTAVPSLSVVPADPAASLGAGTGSSSSSSSASASASAEAPQTTVDSGVIDAPAPVSDSSVVVPPAGPTGQPNNEIPIIPEPASSSAPPLVDLPGPIDIPNPEVPIPNIPLPEIPLPDIPVPEIPVPEIPTPDLPIELPNLPELPIGLPPILDPASPTESTVVESTSSEAPAEATEAPVVDLPLPDLGLEDIISLDIPGSSDPIIKGISTSSAISSSSTSSSLETTSATISTNAPPSLPSQILVIETPLIEVIPTSSSESTESSATSAEETLSSSTILSTSSSSPSSASESTDSTTDSDPVAPTPAAPEAPQNEQPNNEDAPVDVSTALVDAPVQVVEGLVEGATGLLSRRSFSAVPVTNSTSGTVDGVNLTDVANTGSTDTVFITSQCAQALSLPYESIHFDQREDLVMLGFYIWLFALSFIAILNESIPHLIAAFVSSLLAVAWSSFQVVRTNAFRVDFNRFITRGACNGVQLLPNFWTQRMHMAIPSLVINCLFAVVLAFFVFKLSTIYKKDTSKLLGEQTVVQHLYKTVLVLSIIIQVTVFLLMAALALWIDQLFESTIASFSASVNVYKAISVVALVFSVPWFVAGWMGVRKERRWIMAIYFVLTVLFLGSWCAVFASEIYLLIFGKWPFFAALTIVSFAGLVVSLVMSIVCRLRFGQGLATQLAQQSKAEEEKMPWDFSSGTEKGWETFNTTGAQPQPQPQPHLFASNQRW